MFDPYHKWLGISPKDQPPNHYRLLGIDLFESDSDVIDASANRHMAFVQGCATGPHLALSQKLLNELAAARLCLLDSKKKAAYDAKLKASVGARTDRPEWGPTPFSFSADLSSEKPVVRRMTVGKRRWLVLGAVMVLTLAVGMVLAIQSIGTTPQATTATGGNKTAQQTAAHSESVLAPSVDSSEKSIGKAETKLHPEKPKAPQSTQAPQTFWEPTIAQDKKPDSAKGNADERPQAGFPWVTTPTGKEFGKEWAHLIFTRANVQHDFLRIPPKSAISTKAAYTGPIEVVVVARTAKNNIRLYAFNGACVIFNWEVRRNELRVTRPDGGLKTGEGGSLATAKVQPLDANTWYTLRWLITGQGMEVYVDGKPVFSEKRAYNLSAELPVAVKAHESVVDVKSFDVKPLATKNEHPVVVNPENYFPLAIEAVATISSSTCYRNKDRSITWGDRSFFGVPFRLLDPEGGKRKNLIALSGRAPWEKQMPSTVELPCNATAKTIHLLGGVATVAFPWNRQRSTTMIVRLKYEGGETEDHELVNGVHITDWAIGPDVPGSKRVPLEGGVQMRYLSIVPKHKDRRIMTIEFRKGNDQCGPWVLAVTIEK
jgi:hypothetical protein